MTTLKREIYDRTAGKTFLLPLRQRSKALLHYVGEWIRVARNHYEAAGAYEQLSRLSDTELCRRGFSRETLARDIMEAASARRFADGSSSTTQIEGRL